MTNCASTFPPSCGKFLTISFCLWIAILSSSVRSATFFGGVNKAWKSLKLEPETHTARDRCREAASTPLCWTSWYSVAGRSRACGSGSVGKGRPSTILMGSRCLGACCEGSRAGVAGAESFEMSTTRLRFRELAGLFAAFSLTGSGSGAGAASSRALARVDRRGSDMSRNAILW